MANHRYGLFFNETTNTYVATPQSNTMKRDAAIAYLANKLDKSAAKVASVFNSFGKAIAAAGVDFGLTTSVGKFGSSQITVTGGFMGHTGPWVFGKNFLQIILRAAVALKGALASIVPTIITGDVIPTVKSVYDETTDSYNTIHYGSTVAISGDDLAPNEEKEDEGIFLKYKSNDGNKTVKLTNILQNELQIVRFVIDNPEIAVSTGSLAWIIVQTRCGMGESYPLKTIQKPISFQPINNGEVA